MIPFWKFFSFLGSEEFYLLIMPALLWCGNAALGLRVGILFLLSANLNSAAKLFFHAPRPAWQDAKIVAHAVEHSFGFPSGHAQNAMAVWGLLAAKARTWPAWGLALVLMVLIGISRLALRVHFPGDVLGGWLIGAVLLFAFLKLEKPLGAWLLKLDFIPQLAISFTFSLALVALNWGLQQAASNPSIADVRGSFSLNDAVKSAGALFGLLAGACLMLKNGGYANGASAKQKIARFIVGLVGVLALWKGVGALLPTGESNLALFAGYCRYAWIGIWIAAGAPWLFGKMERRADVPGTASHAPTSES